MSRNLCSQIFRPNKKNSARYEIFKNRAIFNFFHFSKKSDKSYFAYFSAILRSIFLSDISFERAKKTGQIGAFFTSRTSYLDIEKIQKPKMQNLSFGVFDKNCSARGFAPKIL